MANVGTILVAVGLMILTECVVISTVFDTLCLC